VFLQMMDGVGRLTTAVEVWECRDGRLALSDDSDLWTPGSGLSRVAVEQGVDILERRKAGAATRGRYRRHLMIISSTCTTQLDQNWPSM
jgi:hypothetical protein